MSRTLLSLEGVSIERGGRTVVRDVSLKLNAGEVLLIIGHNGSGKTTLLHAIAGLIPIMAGTIRWTRSPSDKLRPASLLQEPSVFLDLNVAQNICCGVIGQFKADEERREPLRVKVTREFPELSRAWKSPCADLSGGTRRMVGIARTANTDSSLVLLDEPAVGLTASLAERCLDAVIARAEAGTGVIMVEHGGAAGRIATRLCIMRDGSIVYDGDKAVLQNEERLRSLYL